MAAKWNCLWPLSVEIMCQQWDPGVKFTGMNYRSSHRMCSVRKGVLRNFPKITGKHLCQSLFFNKVAGLRPAPLLKKRLWHRCFPVNFEKFLRTPFYIEHLWWMLLNLGAFQELSNIYKGSAKKQHQKKVTFLLFANSNNWTKLRCLSFVL